jgi:hypothetical protein
MAIGLEAKGYKESETRAGKRHRNRQKVAKRDERAQELSHKAAEDKSIHIQHTNKHAYEIRTDKQKKDPER